MVREGGCQGLGDDDMVAVSVPKTVSAYFSTETLDLMGFFVQHHFGFQTNLVQVEDGSSMAHAKAWQRLIVGAQHNKH